jgi:sterol desaturase/sphingolipid hydroxylase (fatty acid hydroxylase superfamily)
MNFVLYAIPLFFLLIAVELIAEKWRQTDFYRTNDAISSLSAGVLSQMIGLAKNLVPFTLYVVAFDNFALLTWEKSALFWVVAFIFYDFCYYWKHRMGHEVSVLWAAHVVHHSSEEYNLTTALRQTSGSFLGWIFYIPLAVVGVEPYVLVSVGSLNLVYQFWVHTRHVPKLGWFEWFFVSPSNHRVHHAQNALYLDRNYGGVFILWDRLFKTFQEEQENEVPVYGVRKALKSWNPIWTNVQVYSQLMKDSVRTKHWRDKLKVWFGRTGWRPADMERDFPLAKSDLSQFKKFDVQLNLSSKLYAVLQHAMTLGVALLLLLNVQQYSALQQLTIILFVGVCSYTLGTFLEQRSYAFGFEVIKSCLLIVISWSMTANIGVSFGLTLAALVSLALLLWMMRKPQSHLVS